MFNLKINGGNSSNLLFQFKLNACKMFKINEIEVSVWECAMLLQLFSTVNNWPGTKHHQNTNVKQKYYITLDKYIYQ